MFRATTILGLHHKGKTALAGDGQVTYGNTILKGTALKVRKLYNDSVLAGFAGTAADGMALFEKFQNRLEQYRGNLSRAAVELAKEWRSDKFLRRLEAQLAVMDKEKVFLISGTGDVLEPDDNIIALGSGGSYALAAARALVHHSDLTAAQIANEALKIAASICIYTNLNITTLTL
ncbi:ATP-dependent protease subunit HslV [candidate division KSB1 bacterium]|nr:ATP-dependent protease subunit HslV [candidate division KSB1 bacterium]